TIFRLIIWAVGLLNTGPLFGLSTKSSSASMDSSRYNSFKITGVSGQVQYQGPLGGEWHEVQKGVWHPGGILVQVSKGASVTIDSEGSLGRTGIALKASRITINVPMIFRLSQSSFRKISMDPQLVAALPAMSTVKAYEKILVGSTSMLDAWKQDASLLYGKEWLSDDLFKAVDEALSPLSKSNGVLVSGTVTKLILHRPKDKQIILAKDLPVQFGLSWSKPKDVEMDDQGIYKIYFWKAGQLRRVFATAQGNRLTVSANQYGNYFVQVESADGLFQSDLRLVKVQRELASSGLLKDAAKIDRDESLALEVVLNRRVKLLAPIPDLTWMGRGNWPIIEFSWSRPKVSRDQCLYRLVIRDRLNADLFNQRVSEEHVQWHPPASFQGALTWYVQAIVCKNGDGVALQLNTKSNIRKLSFLRGDMKSGFLKSLVQGSVKGTFVYDAF
ncbi:MAG: hypothetical protein NTV34_18405, partial [Proteobacteria bacterium]|nr:hypothetical protein [Pseudomonadota bacterium]